MPIELQPKLLRVIQEPEFERLGSSEATRVDVRIVAATNQNLEQMVMEQQFRVDLYYRLNVFPITLPPLRERADDIPLLVVHFDRTFADRQGKSIEHVPDDVMGAIMNYEWPGNIRELQNFIERSVLLTRSTELRAPVTELTQAGLKCPSHTPADANRAHIIATLLETNWVVGGPNWHSSRGGARSALRARRLQ